MAIFCAEVITTDKCPPTNRIAREDPINLLDVSLDGHLPAKDHFGLLLTEARSSDQNLAGIAGASVANPIALVATTGKSLGTLLAAGERRRPI